MTPAELKAAGAKLAAETTARQGLPLHLEDPTTLDRLAVLFAVDVRPDRTMPQAS